MSGRDPGRMVSVRAERSLGALWQRFFLFATAALTSTILLKIGPIQYLEILYAVQIGLLVTAFSDNGWELTTLKQLLWMGVLYGTFLVSAIGLSFLSLYRDFYILSAVSPLKQPVVIAFVRGAELLASVVVMIYLAQMFRSEPSKTRFAMRVYFWTGMVSTVYALITYPLARANIVYLGTAFDYRARGFFNEGGPYGLYLISLMVIGVSLYQMGWEKRSWILWSAPLILTGFVSSQSKAAAIALLALGALDLLFLRGTTQRVVVGTGIVAIFLLVSQVVDVTQGVRLYRAAGLAYERNSLRHRGDVSFVIGRVAGVFLVPRMIARHPWVGVGWGNYGLVRNAPEYRGASAMVAIADDPGLGVAGLAAEVGLPLTGFLLVCMFLPVMFLQRRRVPFHVVNLALLQPVAHVFGAQLNMTYPWVVTAFALGLGLRMRRPVEEMAVEPAPSRLAFEHGTQSS